MVGETSDITGLAEQEQGTKNESELGTEVASRNLGGWGQLLRDLPALSHLPALCRAR